MRTSTSFRPHVLPLHALVNAHVRGHFPSHVRSQVHRQYKDSSEDVIITSFTQFQHFESFFMDRVGWMCALLTKGKTTQMFTPEVSKIS